MNRIFVCDDKRVWCVDRQTGNMVWNEAVGGWFFKQGKIESMLLDGDSLFVCTEYELCCLKAETGEKQWTTTLEGIASNKAILTEAYPLVNRAAFVKE